MTSGRSSQLLTASGAEQEEDALTAILDRRKPLRVLRQIRAPYVGVVLAVDVRRQRLESRESDERENLAKSVHLDDRGDSVRV